MRHITGSYQKMVDVRWILVPRFLRQFGIPACQPAYLDCEVRDGKVAVHVVVDMDDNWYNPQNHDVYELPRKSRYLTAHCRG